MYNGLFYLYYTMGHIRFTRSAQKVVKSQSPKSGTEYVNTRKKWFC